MSDIGSNVFFEQRDDIADSRAAQSTIMFNGEYSGQLVLFMRSEVIGEIFKAHCDLAYDSQWHHFVARVDSQMHMEIYVDGQLYCESDFGNNGNFVTSIDHVNLGSHHYSEGLHGALNGKMDDVFIYNRSLNMCEIEALYSGLLLNER